MLHKAGLTSQQSCRLGRLHAAACPLRWTLPCACAPVCMQASHCPQPESCSRWGANSCLSLRITLAVGLRGAAGRGLLYSMLGPSGGSLQANGHENREGLI